MEERADGYARRRVLHGGGKLPEIGTVEEHQPDLPVLDVRKHGRDDGAVQAVDMAAQPRRQGHTALRRPFQLHDDEPLAEQLLQYAAVEPSQHFAPAGGRHARPAGDEHGPAAALIRSEGQGIVSPRRDLYRRTRTQSYSMTARDLSRLIGYMPLMK